ncbi:MAG: hypothetical protein IT440_11440 [Phycisphaeraceae bacterium]|nr:hypothetical protein [Phycisphaeraceae bacterium]
MTTCVSLADRLAAMRWPAKAHTPSFRVVEQPRFLLIYDAHRFVALLDRETLYVDLREFYPDGRAGADDEIRFPYHNPSIRGATLMSYWRLDGAQHVCASRHAVTVEETGLRLRLRIDQSFDPDEAGEHELTFRYDPAFGCYVVDTVAHLAMHRPHLVEPGNAWSRGVGEPWPRDATLRYTLFANMNGGLTWFPHNPLTPNLPGNMDTRGRRRVPVGGFIAFGSRDASNPALEIVACHTDAIGFATCDAFYDEHMFVGCPTPLDKDGKYHWSIHYRTLSLPRELMEQMKLEAEMLEMADAPEQAKSWPYLDNLRGAGRQVQPFDQAVPFVPGEVNRCDRAIDPRQVLIGHYWPLTPQPYGVIQWDRAEKAMLLHGHDARANLNCAPRGPSMMMHPGCRYRFSANVKTDLADGASAQLQLTPFLYSPGEIQTPSLSDPLTGRGDWRHVEVHADHGPDLDYLSVSLHLRGAGRAWFTHLHLEEIP